MLQLPYNVHVSNMDMKRFNTPTHAALLCECAMHECVLQMMCSYLAASSAWPVLLGHRDLITLAADTVLYASTEGQVLFLCALCMLTFTPSG